METIQESQPSQQPTNIIQLPIIAVSVLVTALIVGFGVYFLQKLQIENLKNNYESEIQQLRIQVSNLEQANQNIPTPTNNQSVIDCGNNYDCLYRNISDGNSAKVTISEKIDSLFFEEKSEVKIEPFNNQFKVSMTVLELNKIEKAQPMTKSIVGSVSESCPQIVNNLSSIELASASCVANTAEEARNLAKDGLSDTAISKYSCRGKLVDEIKRICVRPDFPNFPPGVKKPAVYLYPLQESKVSVAVDLKGIITKSEPSYYKGWEVVAEPNGLIDGKYDYLFYEAQLEQLQLPKEGWVVEYKELENWFNSNLKELGLNEKEISQFKEYWLAELPFARYYEIKLLDDNFLKENMNLVIDPKPMTVIRRNFYFKPLESQIILERPNIITPERKGFTVVEWGGLLDK
jgi:hypothetical protein